MAGVSHEAASLAEKLGHKIVACVDPQRNSSWPGMAVLQSDDAAIDLGGFEGVVLAIDVPTVRQKVQEFYHRVNVPIVSLLGGSIEPLTSHGAGLFAQVESQIGVGCKLGDGVRLNIGACVLAGSTLADFATLAPRAVALENSYIGVRSYVGTNATILPDTVIGEDCMIGAGAVVSGTIPDGETVIGITGVGLGD